MIEMHLVVLHRQKIKSDDAPILFRAIGRVLRDELRTHRQDIAPSFDPAFGITPMPLRCLRDFCQRIGILWLGADDLHFFSVAAARWAAREQTTPHMTRRYISTLSPAKRLQGFAPIAREWIEVCVPIVDVHAFGAL